MPVSVMILLVVYTFIRLDFTVELYGLPQVISTLLVAFLLVWKECFGRYRGFFD